MRSGDLHRCVSDGWRRIPRGPGGAACLRKPWSLEDDERGRAELRHGDRVVAIRRQHDDRHAGLARRRHDGRDEPCVSGEVIDGAPIAAVRSPRPMKKASIPSTAAMASMHVERCDVLDHRDAGHLRVLRGDVFGKGTSPNRPARVVLAKPRRPAAVAAGGSDLPRLRGAVDVRNEDAGGAAVEHREDIGLARIADAHDAGDVGRARGSTMMSIARRGRRRMLLVDDDEVEAQDAQDLRRVGRGGFDERAEQVLARPRR